MKLHFFCKWHNSKMKSSDMFAGFHYILLIPLFSMNCTFNPLRTLLSVGLGSNFVSSSVHYPKGDTHTRLSWRLYFGSFLCCSLNQKQRSLWLKVSICSIWHHVNLHPNCFSRTLSLPYQVVNTVTPHVLRKSQNVALHSVHTTVLCSSPCKNT